MKTVQKNIHSQGAQSHPEQAVGNTNTVEQYKAILHLTQYSQPRQGQAVHVSACVAATPVVNGQVMKSATNKGEAA